MKNIAVHEFVDEISDEALIKGFLVTVFGAEVTDGANATALTVVKKFTGRVRYHIVDLSTVDRGAILRRFLGQLSLVVHNLTLTETDDPGEAEIIIYVVDRRDYVSTIRATVWPGVDTAFLEANACSAVLAARRSGIERANIYLVGDADFVGFAHCMVEEVAQSLGPANDSSLLPKSIFNDNSTLNFLGIFDWYILNMLYDARIRPGMQEGDVRPLLPAIIADLRKRLPHILAAGGGAMAHHRARSESD